MTHSDDHSGDEPPFDEQSFDRQMDAQSITFSANQEDQGERLDRFLVSRLENYTRSRLKELIKTGHVQRIGNLAHEHSWQQTQGSVQEKGHRKDRREDHGQDNQRTIVEPNNRVRAGDHYRITLPPPSAPEPQPENIPLTIVHEDGDLIVIDKPAGLVVHPATGNWHGTLVNGLLYHCGASLSGIGGVKRPGIVHRLDKDTSGLLVVAKNDKAHLGLSAQFADHGRTGPLKRSYTALIWGKLTPLQGTINAAIGRHPQNPLKMGMRPKDGKIAITHYQTLATFGNQACQKPAHTTRPISSGSLAPDPIASEVSCTLETGRTHQIRVHLAAQNTPLIADPLYGQGFKTKVLLLPENIQNQIAKLNRQALHATTLGFKHPVTGGYLEFHSDLPKKLATLKKSLQTL